jgi:hypothetical protein
LGRDTGNGQELEMKMKALMKSLVGAYLGFSLSMFGKVTYQHWEFYAILVPTIIIAECAYSFSNKRK